MCKTSLQTFFITVLVQIHPGVRIVSQLPSWSSYSWTALRGVLYIVRQFSGKNTNLLFIKFSAKVKNLYGLQGSSEADTKKGHQLFKSTLFAPIQWFFCSRALADSSTTLTEWLGRSYSSLCRCSSSGMGLFVSTNFFISSRACTKTWTSKQNHFCFH